VIQLWDKTYTETLKSSCKLFLPFLDVIGVVLLLAHPIECRSSRHFLSELCDVLQSPAIEVRSRHYQRVCCSHDKTLDARFQRAQIVASLQRAEQFWCDFDRVIGQRNAVFFVTFYLLQIPDNQAMPCILTMKTADLGVLEDLRHCFDRALHGRSQHRNGFGHRLQYGETIDPGTQTSFGSHCDLSQYNLDGGKEKWHYM
jgi:hypothetical protein